MKSRATVVVKGLVQGVNFRRSTQTTATQLGVTGWVRNLSDGSVEGCFEGEEQSVKQLIDWCRQGPAWARVDSIEVSEENYRGEFEGFTILRA